MSDRVIVRIDDAQVAHVTLNRADVHNAFDPEMVEALTSAFARIEDDERIRAVALRGAVLPEGFLGDKSLLFRWHYTIASAHIVADAPWRGVGPDGSQAAYSLHRVPRNPEEVTSAHSMFWDWLCALGISGAAWIALVAFLLWRAGNPQENVS